MLILTLFLYLSIYDVGAARNDFSIDSEVSLPQGKIKGSINLSGTIRRFLGIPYASINGRFQDPGVAKSWNDTYDASQYSFGCKKYLNLFRKFTTTIGIEDCLGLDIYTPLIAGTEEMPVMVIIGGEEWYTDVFDPTSLVEKNNIVVNIHYRLGVLGFLCLRNSGAAGNMGLKDQIAALKWVKNNINHFGGNSNSITLVGQDVGAASINYFLTLPSTNGLFNRAILQSGSMLMPDAFDDDPIQTASVVAALFNFKSSDPDKLQRFYNDLPANDLVKATGKMSLDDPTVPNTFRPCIEAPTEGALITAHPRDLLRTANLNSDVQVIIGYNNREGLKWISKLNYTDPAGLVNSLSDTLIPNYINLQEKDKASFIQSVKEFYIKDKTDVASVVYGLIDYFSDAYIMYPSIATTEYILNYTNASVYNYQFSYFSVRNFAKVSQGFPSIEGSSHGDELFYLFNTMPKLNFVPVFPNDAILMYRMTMMWSYFALKGNPSIPANSQLPFPIQWPESKRNDFKFLDISFEFNTTPVPVPNKERIDFWKSAYEKYGKHK